MHQKTLLGEQFLLYDSRTDGPDQYSPEEDVSVAEAGPPPARTSSYGARAL